MLMTSRGADTGTGGGLVESSLPRSTPDSELSPDLLPDRLRSRIKVDENGCWIWQGQYYEWRGLGRRHCRICRNNASIRKRVREKFAQPVAAARNGGAGFGTAGMGADADAVAGGYRDASALTTLTHGGQN